MDGGKGERLPDQLNSSVEEFEGPRLVIGDGEVGSALEVLVRELIDLNGDRQPQGGELASQLGLMVVGVLPADSSSRHEDGDGACT